jgi:hypothetical protein
MRSLIINTFSLFLLFLHLIGVYGIDILFQDDFDAYADGIYPDNPSGLGAAWLGPFEEVASTWLIEVSSAEQYNGLKSLLMDKIDLPGNYIRAVASFNQSTDNIIYIDYYVRITAGIPPSYPCAIISYRDGTGNEAVRISFNDDSTIGGNGPDDHVYYFSNGTAEIDSGFVYVLDQWYHVRIVADQGTKTYSIYIDDMVNSLVPDVPYYVLAAGYIEEVWFDLDATAPGVYFDDVKIFESSTPPTPDTVPPNDAIINSPNPLISVNNPVIDVDFSDDPAGNLDTVFYKVNDNTHPFTEVIATNINGIYYTQDFQISSSYWDALNPGDSLDLFFLILDDGANSTISTTFIVLQKYEDLTPPYDAVINSENPLYSYDNPLIDVDFFDDPLGDLDTVYYKIDDNTEPFTIIIAENINGVSYTDDFRISQIYWNNLNENESYDIYFKITDDNGNSTISTTYITITRQEYIHQKENITILNNVISQGEEAVIRYEQEKNGNVTVTVFNLSGNIVDILYSGQSNSGEHIYTWDGRNRGGNFVARGFYFIKVVGPGVSEIRKVLVVK